MITSRAVEQISRMANQGRLSTPVLTSAELNDLVMDYDSCTQHQTSLGASGTIVINEQASMPQMALPAAEFFTEKDKTL
jgi:NADH-quinone oxidoreductase subunit E/NADH-quinone oxidoreductase subunit F